MLRPQHESAAATIHPAARTRLGVPARPRARGVARRRCHARRYGQPARAKKAPGKLDRQRLESLRMDRRQAEAEIVKVWNNLIDPDSRRARPAHRHP